MPEVVADLLAFIDRSPTPYHAVAESVRRLEAAGFHGVAETEVWEVAPGDRLYAVRNEGSLAALQVGAVTPAEAGFRIIGAHSDSPNLRIKPRADLEAHGYRQLAVEPYGGLLRHTWLDRDLSLAGRVSLAVDAGLRTLLVDFERPLLRIPNLAIHLQRRINRDGLKLNAQQHLAPLLGLEDAPPLPDLLIAELRNGGLGEVDAADIRAYDLMAYDTQPACLAGSRGEFIHASRIDNLASCHAGVSALLVAASESTPPFTRMVVLYDHEEVGSRSAQGAGGTFLSTTLERVVSGFESGGPQDLARAIAHSTLVSADMAHAVHPNYSDRHEPGHRPVIGKGPVIKVNSEQSYASDAATAGLFATLCHRVGVEPQYFVTRSDIRCGTTIGPVSAARVGLRTVDVGNPMLSMHSCREMAGTADVEPMIEVMRAFFDE
jgi:aspartyl aminopeptidase